MAKLLTYQDFVERVNELGFMAFSNIVPGFPSLSEETLEENWHTGEPDTDPWSWKDRVAEEKQMAFGCILGGHKGFVSARMYSVFHKAYHPREHMEERRALGLVNQTEWDLWQLFEEHSLLNTSEIRKMMGVTKKEGGSKVDRGIQELQQQYYITVAGNQRKCDQYGQPYGWPAILYNRVEEWVPSEWMENQGDLTSEEAKERILEHAIAISNKVSLKDLRKKLRLNSY